MYGLFTLLSFLIYSSNSKPIDECEELLSNAKEQHSWIKYNNSAKIASDLQNRRSTSSLYIDKNITVWTGYPEFLKPVLNSNEIIFRRYINNEFDLSLGLNNQIFPSIAPLSIQSKNTVDTYQDVTGTFITSYDYADSYFKQFGKHPIDSEYYIDFKLLPGTLVFTSRPGQEYVIPGHPRKPEWIMNAIKTGNWPHYIDTETQLKYKNSPSAMPVTIQTLGIYTIDNIKIK